MIELPDSAMDDVRALHALWLAKRAGRAVPTRADFPFEELRPWLGWLFILDVLGGGEFRYRLYGSRIRERHGAELTGMKVSELHPDFRAVIEPGYRAVATEAVPRYDALSFDGPSGLHKWQRLILPLSNDGRSVTGLLCLLSELYFRYRT